MDAAVAVVVDGPVDVLEALAHVARARRANLVGTADEEGLRNAGGREFGPAAIHVQEFQAADTGVEDAKAVEIYVDEELAPDAEAAVVVPDEVPEGRGRPEGSRPARRPVDGREVVAQLEAVPLRGMRYVAVEASERRVHGALLDVGVDVRLAADAVRLLERAVPEAVVGRARRDVPVDVVVGVDDPVTRG